MLPVPTGRRDSREIRAIPAVLERRVRLASSVLKVLWVTLVRTDSLDCKVLLV